jgi:hypothetical protein
MYYDTNVLYGTTVIKFPKYIQKIIENITCTGVYTYRLRGVNQYRPQYGIYADMEKLIKWAERHCAECTVIKYHTMPNNHYVDFKLTDPVAYALEKQGI